MLGNHVCGNWPDAFSALFTSSLPFSYVCRSLVPRVIKCTFMHLEDTFIQSYLQVINFYFISLEIVQPTMKIRSLFTHPRVVPNLCAVAFWVEHKMRIVLCLSGQYKSCMLFSKSAEAMQQLCMNKRLKFSFFIHRTSLAPFDVYIWFVHSKKMKVLYWHQWFNDETLKGHRMQNSLYKLFEHKCELEVCVHIHPIMIKIHPVFFLIPILNSLYESLQIAFPNNVQVSQFHG